MSDTVTPAQPSDLARVRNFGVVAHIDAGKTTLCERMLVRTGVEARPGEVEDGTAALDWMPEERERGISISAAATSLPWREHQLHLIDTPGHVDFTIEVERSLRVLDGAIIVFDVLAGVQAQSEAVWKQMRRHGCAAVAFVNKLDRAGADFMSALGGIERRLGVRCAAVAYPYYRAAELVMVADVVRLCAIGSCVGARPALWVELPAAIVEEVGVLRAELAELLAEEDDEIFECVADGRTPAAELMLAALRRRTLDGSLLAVACGSALNAIGIDAALDLVVDLLPSPADKPPVRVIASGGAELVLVQRADEPMLLFAFKLQRIGARDLVFVRVMRGQLRAGDQAVVARGPANVTARAIYRPHADSLEPVELAVCGDIVAVEGFDSVATGDTICDPRSVCALEGLEVPAPVLSLAVEPVSAKDREALRAGLARLVREDPSLAVREEEASGQWILSGMGELHLEIALGQLRAQTKLAVRSSAPQVAYREVLLQPLRASARIERAFGTATLLGAIELEVLPVREANSVEVSFDAEAAPAQAYQPAIAATLASLAMVGPASGNPLSRARIHVRAAGRAGEADSEAGVLQAVGSAWHELLPRLEVELHEPWMSFEVLTPSAYAGGVLGDLQARSAVISEVQSQGTATRIQGGVPLYGMFGYASAARSLTQGRAEFSMRPAGTRAVPRQDLAARGLAGE